MSNTDQVSVPLPAELREYVRQVAEVEERSQAAVTGDWLPRRRVSRALRRRLSGDRSRADVYSGGGPRRADSADRQGLGIHHERRGRRDPARQSRRLSCSAARLRLSSSIKFVLSPLWVIAVSAEIAAWRLQLEEYHPPEHFDPLAGRTAPRV